MKPLLKLTVVMLILTWSLRFSASAQSGCDSTGYSTCLTNAANEMPGCVQGCKSYPTSSPAYLSCTVGCNELLGDLQRSCEAEYPGCPTICTYPYGPGDGCGD